MKYKIRCFTYFLFERKALETYINQQAEKGYHIQSLFSHCLIFKRENKQSFYHVCFTNRMDESDIYGKNKDVWELESYMEELCLQRVTGQKMFQIYADSQKQDIYTDPVAELEGIKKISKMYEWRGLRYILLIVAGFVLVECLSFFLMPQGAMMFLANTNLAIVNLINILILMFAWFDYKPLRVFKKDPYLESDPKVFTKRALFPCAFAAGVFAWIVLVDLRFVLWLSIIPFSWLVRSLKMRKGLTLAFSALMILLFCVIKGPVHIGSMTNSGTGLQPDFKYDTYRHLESPFLVYEQSVNKNTKKDRLKNRW